MKIVIGSGLGQATKVERTSFSHQTIFPSCIVKILHKTDIGGVVLNLHSADEVRQGFHRILAAVQAAIPEETWVIGKLAVGDRKVVLE